MQRLFLTLVWLSFAGNCTFAQPSTAQTTDKQQISTTLGTYFKGWIAKDTTLLSSVMHSSCHLKYYRDKTFYQFNKQEYLALFKDTTPRKDSVKTDILFVDVTNTMAQAKIKIETGKTIGFDYFNLLKIDDVWMIVDKVSTSSSK